MPAVLRHDQAGAARALIEQCRSFAHSQDRDDLVRRLDRAATRVDRPGVQLMVVGEFKQGKSSLINALMGETICPVDDDVATAVLTYVSYAEEAAAHAHRLGEDGVLQVISFDPGSAAEFVSEAGNPGNRKQLLRVEFGLPKPLLATGLTIVDSPGVGGLESAHGAVTLGALAEADAVIFMTDASQELTRPELDFLGHAHQLCPTVIHVLSKIDLYPEWRRMRTLCEQHLRDAGLPGVVVGASSTLHEQAGRLGDNELISESGIPDLLALLQRDVIDPGERFVLRAALSDVASARNQLAGPIEVEHAILSDPAQVSQVMAEFERAKAMAGDLQSRSAGWQVSLNDGVSDLNSDVDHDLRARTRRLIQESEATIDDIDPADMWDEFESQLYARTTSEVVDNFSLLTARVDELVALVEEHFSAAEHNLAQAFGVVAPVGALEGLTIESSVDVARSGILTQGMTGLRGSYGGVLMFSMIGNMAGLAAMNPAILVVGLLMGRKSLRDEKKRQLSTRRQQAKSAVRKYVDEVSFQVGKDSRDSLRLTQRAFRDHFGARAEELARSTQETLQAAQAAARSDAESRKTRVGELGTMLLRLNAIGDQVESITARVDRP